MCPFVGIVFLLCVTPVVEGVLEWGKLWENHGGRREPWENIGKSFRIYGAIRYEIIEYLMYLTEISLLVKMSEQVHNVINKLMFVEIKKIMLR